MRIILLIQILSSPLVLNSQIQINAESIAKIFLYLDNRNNLLIKNIDLLADFDNVASIELEELETKNIEFNYIFYTFSIKNIEYDLSKSSLPTSKEDTALLHLVTSGFNEKFVFCVDTDTGKSYRILGFSSNDLLFFLSDYLEKYNNKYFNKKTLTSKKIIQLIKVEGVDFECIFSALKNKEIDRRKYPCLYRVNDLIYIE